MNFRDALRQAEQQGKESVHRGAEKLHSIETSIRRKMRGRDAGAGLPNPEQDNDVPRSSKVRTGIVSVNGRDVEEIHCTGGRRRPA